MTEQLYFQYTIAIITSTFVVLLMTYALTKISTTLYQMKKGYIAKNSAMQKSLTLVAICLMAVLGAGFVSFAKYGIVEANIVGYLYTLALLVYGAGFLLSVKLKKQEHELNEKKYAKQS